VPSILIIDDEAMVRMAVALILENQGWRTRQASDGQDGLDQARREPPDLIVCDLNMPVLDGFETLAELRRDPALQSIPCVVITGQPGRDNERRALDAGAKAVLLKPFRNDTLVQTIERHLRAGGSASP
jgi:CheY-like chemotaxis protein